MAEVQSVTREYLLELDIRKAEELEGKQETKAEALGMYKSILERLPGDSDRREEIEEKIKSLSEGKREVPDGWRIPTTTYADITGMKRYKRIIDDQIKLPMLKGSGYERFRIKKGGAFLLYGPPGVGKSALLRCAAGELKIPMKIVRVNEILTKWVGEGEKNIMKLFVEAYSTEPCILIFDELDALAQSRDGSAAEVSSNELRNIVTELLTQMDSLNEDKKSRIYVVGTTNRPYAIDTAMKRSGRFDYALYVRPPTRKERENIIKLYMDEGKDRYAKRINYFWLSLALADYSPADIERICRAAKIDAIKEGQESITNQSILRVLKDKDMGKSSLDEWYIMMKNTYIGNQKEITVKEGGQKIKRKVGPEGKFTKEDRRFYKEMVKDVNRHIKNFWWIRSIRFIARGW